MDYAVSITAYTVIQDNKKTPGWVPFCYGGDGGNRNRVRKSIPASFYERSLSFEIPLRECRQTGSLLRYPLDHDELQGYSFIHVHC